MSFLNPIMLAGLAAISVPIIIHLLNRRKFQKVIWGAMRFLQASVEQNQRRMRVEDLILLALRCLMLALLALALARPAILSESSDLFGQSKVTGFILLDNSYSMGMSDGIQTRFEKAKEAAEQAVNSMPAGSATAVLLASDIAVGAIPEPSFDLNLARQTIRQAPLSDRPTDLFPALNEAIGSLRDRLAIRKEVFLITDGQATGWRQLVEIQRLLETSRNDVKSHVILVNEHEQSNLCLSGLRLASGLSPANQPLRFEVRVTNFGLQEARNIPVKIRVNAEPPSDAFTIDSLAPGATRSVSLFAKLPRAGFHTISASLPKDRLAADDQRSLALRAINRVRVLLVDGDPGAEARDGETYFLRHALAPVAQDRLLDYFIQPEIISPPELAAVRLDDYDAVFLANVSDFSPDLLDQFSQYLQRGGGLIVFPGGNVDARFYNEQLFQQYQFLPAALGSPRGDAAQEDTPLHFQAQNYVHPTVSIWNDPASGTLASARFFRSFVLQSEPVSDNTTTNQSPPASTANPVPQAGAPRIILNFEDGTPAVMERDWGLGRVVLFSSSADTSWNDLPVRLSFVPLMHRTLGSIVQRRDEGLNIQVGDPLLYRLPLEFLGKDATFFRPRQEQAARDLRQIDLVDGWPSLQYQYTDEAGIYDVSVAEPELTLKFAAQSVPGESSLDELSPDQLGTLNDVAQVIPWTTDLNLRDQVEQNRSGWEFWLPIIMLVLGLALLETFLAQWFSRSK